jgi:hypothetical protein
MQMRKGSRLSAVRKRARLTPARGELLAWLNELLGQAPAKVEECGKGAIYCQVSSEVHDSPVPCDREARCMIAEGRASAVEHRADGQIIDSIYGTCTSLRLRSA